MDLYSYFMVGHDYMMKKRFNLAIKVFVDIVNGEDTTYHSGAYVNLARCTLEKMIQEEGKAGLKNLAKDELIHSYLDKALYYKPTNQSAFNIFFNYHFAFQRYVEAIDYFLKLDRSLAEQCKGYFMLLQDECNKELIEALEKVYKKYPHYSEVGWLIGHMYMKLEEYPQAYYYYRKMNDRDVEDLSALMGLSLVCNVLKKPAEGEKYCLNGIYITDKYKKRAKNKEREEEMEEMKQKLITNLGMSYLNQNKYPEVISLLEPKLKHNPNNTDYHNLAHAYYKLQDFKRSLENCEKGLYISEDETTYLLTADNNFALGEYTESINWYKKAIQFIEAGETFFIYDEPNETLSSSSSLIEKEEVHKGAYISIIQASIESKDFILANVYYNLAVEKWPYDNQLFKFKKNIDSMIQAEEEKEEVKQKMEVIHREREQLEKTFNEKINKVKEWAVSLLKLQNRCKEYVNIDSEDDWKIIERQMVEIAHKMVEENKDNQDYQDIKNKYKTIYPHLNYKSLSFLSTGEFLFHLHEKETMDYAPIMIEYCKVFETELNEVLKKRKLLNKKRNYTLGQILVELENNAPLGWDKFTITLREVIQYRNGSAHTGQSTREKVSKVRSYLLEDKWLDFILDWKGQKCVSV